MRKIIVLAVFVYLALCLGGILQAQTPDERHLIARVVYAEAAGEPLAGKKAVASVILNRVDEDGFPDTIEEVVYQRNAFQSVTDGSRLWRESENPQKFSKGQRKTWDDCVRAVDAAIEHRVPRIIAFRVGSGSERYFKKLRWIARIGHQDFYSNR